MLPKILFFSYHQFGNLVDTLKYCEHLRTQFDITYVGWDYGKPKVNIEGIKVKYVSRSGSLLKRNTELLSALHKEIKHGCYDLVFMHYTRGISVLKLLHWKQKMIFDVRTLSVDRNFVKREFYNKVLKIESLFFKNRSVISTGIGRQMKLKKYHLLPLGADVIPTTEAEDRNFGLRLLYVGTLQNRNIIKCVYGLHEYIRITGDKDITMTIVGDSPGNECLEIIEYTNKFPELKNSVKCEGRVAHHELGKYFSKANVGISFIPMTKWYDHQPPTKTFEYLLSGLSVIATNTYENKKVLQHEEMSVLIDDNEGDFCRAITEIKKKLGNLNAEELKSRHQNHLWTSVIHNYFIRMIDNVRG